MNPIWESTFKVRAFDIDSKDRLKVNAIMDYFQDAASNDAERLNFGYTNFVPKGLTWVLSWAKFEFIRYPKFMDEVKIQSWGKKQHKLHSIRDYLLLDSMNNILCRGTSAWLLIDLKSFRPKVLPQLFPDIKMFGEKNALIDLPQKIIPPKNLEKVYKTQIRYTDIDLNQHVNNAKYIELLLDCFDEQFHKENSLRLLTVSFNAESKFGDEVELYSGIIGHNPQRRYIEVRNITFSKTVFQSVVEWNK